MTNSEGFQVYSSNEKEMMNDLSNESLSIIFILRRIASFQNKYT